MIVSDLSKGTNRRYEGAPPIAMEIVSPSSQYNDYIYKLSMYCKYGMKEYWIIDPAKEKIVVYNFGEDLSPQMYTFHDLISSHVCPAIRVDFARIRQILIERGLIPQDSDPEDNRDSN